MSLFFAKEVSSLHTSDVHLDWDPENLNTLVLGKTRIQNEIGVFINTPKGTIFKARELGSTVLNYLFAPYEETLPAQLTSELVTDLNAEISGVRVTKVQTHSDPEKKTLLINVHLTIEDKTYVLPVDVRARS